MAYTKLADMIVPDKWAQYVIDQTTERSALFQSGIIQDFSGVVNIGEGGQTVNMPFFQDLSGADEIRDDTSDLTVNNVDTAKDVAVILRRSKVFGSSDIAGDIAGADPMSIIGDRFATYWNIRFQKTLIETLNGAMGAVTDNVLDISGATSPADQFDAEAFLEAQGKLGDSQEALTAMAVHSDTYTTMKRQDLIQFIPNSQGVPDIPTYQGRQVIVDDGMPVSSGTYTTYLFGSGAIGMAEGVPKTPVESDREPLINGGSEFIVNHRDFVMHPRGVAWTPGGGVPALNSPSNTELGNSANWTQKYQSKNIRIVQFKHTLP